jgi:class 3 adenylate cyclase
MISGNIGSASLRRLDYTVIGDTVNTAQRLQGAAQPGQILLREEAYTQIRESFNCRAVGEITVKNKQEPLIAYEVID